MKILQLIASNSDADLQQLVAIKFRLMKNCFLSWVYNQNMNKTSRKMSRLYLAFCWITVLIKFNIMTCICDLNVIIQVKRAVQYRITLCGLVTSFDNGTKPLPEPMLTNDQWDVVAFSWQHFHRKYPRYLLLQWVGNLLISDCSQMPQGQMS